MGELITLLRRDLLIPTQEGLIESNTLSLLEYYVQYGKSPAPPSIVEKISAGKFYIIDGHHRICLDDVFGVKSQLYIPDNEDDEIPKELVPEEVRKYLPEMNLRIKKRFNYVMNIQWTFKKNYPKSIREMREKYPSLKNRQTAIDFFSHAYIPFD